MSVLSVAPKAAGFAMIIRFFHQVFSDGNALGSSMVGSTGMPWPVILGVLAVVSLSLGFVVSHLMLFTPFIIVILKSPTPPTRHL